MTPEQITLVRSSFQRLGPQLPAMATRSAAHVGSLAGGNAGNTHGTTLVYAQRRTLMPRTGSSATGTAPDPGHAHKVSRQPLTRRAARYRKIIT